VSEKSLADAHHRISDAEHAVERKMRRRAEAMPDPEHMQRRARSIVKKTRGHDRAAERIEKRTEQ